MMHHGGKTIGYMPGLDGLRTLAVFAVIGYHLNLQWISGGLLGVNLFFVLSGYLITSILFSQWETNGRINLKDFWIRRARRLLPALFLMLICLLVWGIFFNPEHINSLRHETLAAFFYVSNWYLIFHEVSYFESFGPPSPLGHLWSLAIEEQFYLFWPLILGLGFRIFKKRKWIIGGTIAIIVISTLAMAVIYTPGDDPSRVYYGTDTRAYALLLGALAAMIWPGGKMSADISRSKKLSVDLAGAGSLIFILWMLVSTNQYQVFLYRGGLFIFSLVATLFVVVLAHPAGIFGRIFSVEPLRLLGKWSYGIYLWHYPVIILSTPYIDTDGPNVLRSLWQIAVSIALAALSFYLIEEPIRFKRIKLAKIFSRATACILIIFMVLIVTSTEGLQILAKDRVTDTYEQIGSVEDEIEIEPGKDEIEAESGKDEIEAEPGKNEIEAESEKNEIEAESGKDNVKNVIDSGEGITIISDSLLIDAKPIIEDRLPGIIINTKKGRQMYDAPEVVDELRSTGRLGDTVIIGLGSNGAFTEKQLKATIDCLEGAGEIILINTRVPKPWETVVNDILAQVVEFYPEVTLIDWYDVSKGHNEYFYKDGVHLNNVGIEAYIEMLLNAL